MNNKGAVEMSIGTIIIIVLSMSMLILGMILVKNLFEKPEIKITEEVCNNEIGDYNGYIIPTNLEKYFSDNYMNGTYLWNADRQHLEHYDYKEICEDIEVEEMRFRKLCNEDICMVTENNDMYFKVITKEELTIEWLDENCKGYCYGCASDIMAEMPCCGYGFGEYACGDYKVEVLK